MTAAAVALLAGCGGGEEEQEAAVGSPASPSDPTTSSAPADAAPSDPAPSPSSAAGTGLAPLPETLLGLQAEAEDAVPPELGGDAQAVARGYVGPDGERVLDVLVIDAGEQLDPAAELPAYFEGIAASGATLSAEPVPVAAGGDGAAACADFSSQRSATACVLIDGTRLLSTSDYRSPGTEQAGDGLREVRQALGL